MARTSSGMRAAVLLTSALVLAIVAACGGGDGEEPATVVPNGDAARTPSGTVAGGAVEVGLDEFALTLSASSASAGSVTFEVRNEGAIAHDFLVVRSDLAPEALPVDESAFVVDESQVDVVASTDTLLVTQDEELTVDLEPGAYVLICNIPGHYEGGMYAGFSVQ